MQTSLKICIFFKTVRKPWGGGNQFLRSLAGELSTMGHRVTATPTRKTQVILLNAHNAGPNRYIDPRRVDAMKSARASVRDRLLPAWRSRQAQPGPVVLHRLDGVPEIVRGRRTKADDVVVATNRRADYTVFQSHYCRDVYEKARAIRPEKWRVIHNGVSPTVFSPAQDVKVDGRPLRLVAVSWSPSLRKGFETLAEVSRLRDVRLTFAGNWCPDVPRANVNVVGVLTQTDLANLLRSSHAMIHAAWDEASSNAVMEAMACGLPVLYRDSGGNREIAGAYGIAISDELPSMVRELRERYAELRVRLLSDRKHFLIQRAAREYVSAFEHALEHHASAP